MQLTATFEEISAYVKERFGQQIALSRGERGELRLSYVKRVLIKDVSVGIGLTFDEVKADSLTISYNGGMAIDMIVGGALSFFTNQFSELAAGIHPQDNHKILINLAEMEKAKPVVENIALTSIQIAPNALIIDFTLKVPQKKSK